MTNTRRCAAIMLMLTVAVLCGCNRNTPTPETAPTNAQATPVTPAPMPAPETKPETSKSPLKDAVEQVIAQSETAFPKGTHLQSVNLEKGVATLDFSPEFSALANMGDSTESVAQKTLMATLSQFPIVEKMRVTVNGKPFDSQATDWNTPFPVRTASQLSPKTNGGEAQ